MVDIYADTHGAPHSGYAGTCIVFSLYGLVQCHIYKSHIRCVFLLSKQSYIAAFGVIDVKLDLAPPTKRYNTVHSIRKLLLQKLCETPLFK